MKGFHSLKGGARKVLPCLEGGGGAKRFGPAIFPFCSPPLLINDQSLILQTSVLNEFRWFYLLVDREVDPEAEAHYMTSGGAVRVTPLPPPPHRTAQLPSCDAASFARLTLSPTLKCMVHGSQDNPGQSVFPGNTQSLSCYFPIVKLTKP